MYSSRFSSRTHHLAFGPSTTLPILAVIIVVIVAVFVPVAHAESGSYTVILDPNGGAWDSSESASFTVSIGNKVTLPVYKGSVPDGKIFAGWSYSNGCLDQVQGVKYVDGTVFKMTSDVAAYATGTVITLYATWIPKLTTITEGEVYVQSILLAGEDVVVDLRLPYDLTVGTYVLTEGSLPSQVPSENEPYHFSVNGGVCTVTSSEMFPGVGNLWIVIPVFYAIGSEVGPSGCYEVLVEWILDLTFVPEFTSV